MFRQCWTLFRLQRCPDSSAWVPSLSLALDASVVTAQGPVDSHQWSTASFVHPSPLSLRCVLQYVSTQYASGPIWAPPTTGPWVHTDCVCVCFLCSVVEDDEDGFPTTRSNGEFLHNNNGSKEKRECFYWFLHVGNFSRFFTLNEFSLIQLEETVLGRHWHYEQFVHLIYSSEPVIWACSNELCEICNIKSAYLQWSCVWDVFTELCISA